MPGQEKVTSISSSGNGENREEGIGQTMAKHHLSLAQATTARCLNVVTPEGSPQIEPQSGGEGAAQQQSEGPCRQHQMADGAA